MEFGALYFESQIDNKLKGIIEEAKEEIKEGEEGKEGEGRNERRKRRENAERKKTRDRESRGMRACRGSALQLHALLNNAYICF